MKNTLIKIIAATAYVLMVRINFLANSLPINGRTPGEISDSYPNLFAPAGFAFSIWGLIYLWLGAFVIYQLIQKTQQNATDHETFNRKINLLFIGTSVANVSWILAWHYDRIGLSLVVMLTLLGFLIKIANLVNNKRLTIKDKFFVAMPFSVYFGWITVATIANVTVFLVSIGFKGFGVPEFVWTIAVLLVGFFIGFFRMKRDKNVIYGLVFIWAYFGILIKHISENGWNKEYPSIIITTVFCLLLLVSAVAHLIKTRSREIE